MAYTTIDDPSEYFITTLYTGNGSDAHSITNSANSGNFKPDWLWTKNRTGTARNNSIFDSSRGINKYVYTNQQDAEADVSISLQSFDTNGFTVGTSTQVNPNGNSMVAWQWKANGGSRTTFTESGNNPGGGYQANTTAGFSIVDYTGTGGAGTVQHGLGAVPELIIFKDRGDSSNWLVYTEPTANTHTLFLNRDVAKEDDNTLYNDTTPTSSVFTVGTHNDINANNDTYIAYCFTSIKGYSRIGSYTGNGSSDGTFVYTGFKPSWIIIKRHNSTGNWFIFDNKRDGFNSENYRLQADSTAVEADPGEFEILSNGFKIRFTSGNVNGSGGKYIYMAFAEHPFVSSKGVPTTAR